MTLDALDVHINIVYQIASFLRCRHLSKQNLLSLVNQSHFQKILHYWHITKKNEINIIAFWRRLRIHLFEP